MNISEKPDAWSQIAKRSKVSGFTMIELMIVLVIVAIGVALAVPSFRSITEKRQLVRAAEGVAAFINLAQSAAVKYDQDLNLNIQRTDADTWCMGMNLGATACDCFADPADLDFCEVNGVPRRILHADVVANPNYQLLQSVLVNETAESDVNITFDPVRGTLLNLETISFEMHTNTGTGANKEYQVNVNVLPTGRASLCTATGRKRLLKAFPTCS